MYANSILFPQVSNRETFDPIVALFDDETGDALDLSSITTIQVEVRRQSIPGEAFGSALFPFAGPYGAPILAASLGNGVTVIDVGVLQIIFTETQMRTLRPGTYSIACTISDGTTTRQLFIGRLPVIDGGVTQ